MFDSKLSKVLTFGLPAFLVLSVLIRLGKVYVLRDYDMSLSWFNIVGAVIIALALVFFIMERRSNLPFFYGRSQNGGSNANSFVVAAVGLNFLNLTTVQFAIYTFALIIAMLLLAYTIKAKN